MKKEIKSEIKYELLQKIQQSFQSINDSPIVLCVGSNKVAGDCLGPLVGHLLVEKYKIKTFVYGTMKNPVNALNISEVSHFISAMHGDTPVLTIDAAVGKADSIGKIKVSDDGIYPGLATGRVLDKIGTHSIIGIVEEQSYLSESLLVNTKLHFVYEMAKTIAEAINDFLLVRESALILQ